MKIFTDPPRLMTTTGIKAVLLTIALGLAAPGLVGAADFDGSRNLLCVPTDSIQCEGAGYCERLKAEDLNMAKFLYVDFAKKQLRGKVSGGTEDETTPIQNVQKSDLVTLVQGAENGRGYSVVIDNQTGDMSLTVAGDHIAFVFFGVCQAR